MKGYAIYDTKTGKYWSNPYGRFVWPDVGSAKNAWNWQRPRRTPPFSQQTPFECDEGTFEFTRW